MSSWDGQSKEGLTNSIGLQRTGSKSRVRLVFKWALWGLGCFLVGDRREEQRVDMAVLEEGGGVPWVSRAGKPH